MEIFDTISMHSNAMGLPLFAVTVAAAAKADTPMILILHWHGFGRETAVSLPGMPTPRRSVAGSALQINQRWRSVETIDEALLEAAWRLGAWDVERLAGRPWWRLGASDGETLACYRAFGEYPDREAGQEPVIADAPDREEVMWLAANRGYIRWMFRPRKGGVWGHVADEDCTLEPDGGRSLPCPVRPRSFDMDGARRTVYRLGYVDRIILP
jgi:hypothetical protein